MTDQATPLYDIYISYASSDAQWVDGWLLPRLRAAGLTVAIDYEMFIVGKPRIENIESAIQLSHRTLVILSPDWVNSEWNAFEAACVRFTDPLAVRRKLLPVLRYPCVIPQWIMQLEKVDLSNTARSEKEVRRLIRDIEDTVPLPPLKAIGAGPFMWRWGRRHQRLAKAVTTLLLFVLALLFQQQGWWPFQWQWGWRALGKLDAVGVSHLVRADALYVTTHTDTTLPLGTSDTGLWQSINEGQSWTPIAIPLQFTSTQGVLLAEIHDLATSTTRPAHLFAATSHVGLLHHVEGKQGWRNVTSKPLPDKLIRVGIVPNHPERIFVVAEAGGLYRSVDMGESWVRLDVMARCKAEHDGKLSLPVNLAVSALLVSEQRVYVGTTILDYSPAPHAGLYMSDDQGECWRLMHDGQDMYGYRAFAQVPGTTDQLLVLVYNFSVTDPFILWKLDPSRGQPQVLWRSKHSVTDRILISRETEAQWYVVTDDGTVYSGGLDAVVTAEKHLRPMPRCWLLTCEVDIAFAEDGKTPILLAADKLYRAEEVPLVRLLWP